MDLAAAAARGLATLSHSTVACLLGSRISAQGAVRTTTPQARTAPRQPLPDAAPLVQHAARGHSLREVVFDYASGPNGTEHNPAPSPSGHHPLLSGRPTETEITRGSLRELLLEL